MTGYRYLIQYEQHLKEVSGSNIHNFEIDLYLPTYHKIITRRPFFKTQNILIVALFRIHSQRSLNMCFLKYCIVFKKINTYIFHQFLVLDLMAKLRGAATEKE